MHPPYLLSQALNIAEQLKPAVEELLLSADGNAYQVVSKCDLELELTHANKGVEGIQYYDAGDRGTYHLPSSFFPGCIAASLVCSYSAAGA